MVNWILGDLFLKEFGHQGSIQKLWEQRWKVPCQRSVYPFHDGKFEDFEPIFTKLIENDINDPYDDAYTSAFIPTAEALTKAAAEAEATDKARAIELYKRASVVYRLSRFPYIGTPLKRRVFDTQKEVYLRGARLWDVPLTEKVIPHTYAAEGDEKEIPLYVRIPPNASEDKPCPVMLLITGLDGHRPDNTERTEEHLKRGWATVICDIPGVADCPALKTDPLSPDRLFESILHWINTEPDFKAHKVIAWGLSAGGYYAIRVAHTHADKLAGAVGHGAGTHHYIGREWLEEVNHHEYPFDLTKAYCMKYGYDNFEELKDKCQKTFSLVENGIVHMKSTRLLLINGVLDGCMPIEDSMLLFEYGSPKEARFIQGRAHMGYPEANAHVFPWLEQVMGTYVRL
ncbi:Alpha/Beta hydrolase protein [Lineolata rhizophorae]|uniref:Alpha/Beta hydrolase protein n=1 Tax=Lineolata rhizophorae TaxID=578093 RepID=A0A6A6NW99_9PEZI|nr:Alpha/Beta hydrolase protein [Lineolata rhizophorae]